MNSLFNTVRHRVSADKNRYRNGTFDLDLTYITDRIVAMAFPAEGMESTYRNNIDHVADLLSKQHPNHFLLYNLSNRGYDASKFGGQVREWCGFPDHHPPPLALLFKIVRSIHEWLSADPDNVAVIHCLAGKGRTGTVIASYFLYCGLMPTIDDAMNFFSYRRSVNSWGVTGPSQIRYLDYFENILHHGGTPHTRVMKIIQVSFEPIPRFSIGGGEKGCTPFFEIYQLQREKVLLYSSETVSDEFQSFEVRRDEEATFYPDCVVNGDIIIHFKHYSPLHGAEPMFHFSFNVGMVQGNTVITMRHEIEKAEKDSRFPLNFRTIVVMEPVPAEMAAEVNNQLVDFDPETNTDQLITPEQLFQPLPPEERNGLICFRGSLERQQNLVEIARDIGCPTKGAYTVKGGWMLMLERKGNLLKTHRRWFLLKGSVLSYHRAPRDLKALGSLSIGLIQSIRLIDSIEHFPFTFKIETVGNALNLLLTAQSKSSLESWVKAIAYARDLFHVKHERPKQHTQSSLKVHIGECRSVTLSDELCCTLQIGDQTFTSIIVNYPSSSSSRSPRSLQPIVLDFDDHFTFFLESSNESLSITLSEAMDEQGPTRVLGQQVIALSELKDSSYRDAWIALLPPPGELESASSPLVSSSTSPAAARLDEEEEEEGGISLDSDGEENNEPGDEDELSEPEEEEESSDIQLHVQVYHYESRSEELINAQGELIFSPELIPTSSKSGEEQSMTTRMRTYEKNAQYHATYPNFVGLPSEYRWISAPASPKRDKSALVRSVSQISGGRSVSAPSRPPDLAGSEQFELARVSHFDCPEHQITCGIPLDDELWLGTSTGSIHVWNRQEEREMVCMHGHAYPVTSMLVASGRVWSASQDLLCVWAGEKEQYKCLKKFPLDGNHPWAIARVHTHEVNQVWGYMKDRTGASGNIIVWCAKTLSVKKRFMLRSTSIGCIHQHQESVWVGVLDFLIRFNPLTFQRESLIKVGLGMVTNIVAYRKYLWLSSSFSSRICVWNFNTEEQLHTLCEPEGKVLAMSRVDHFILAAGEEQNIMVWDLRTCKFIRTISTGHREAVCQLVQAPRTSYLFSISKTLVICWDFYPEAVK